MTAFWKNIHIYNTTTASCITISSSASLHQSLFIYLNYSRSVPCKWICPYSGTRNTFSFFVKLIRNDLCMQIVNVLLNLSHEYSIISTWDMTCNTICLDTNQRPKRIADQGKILKPQHFIKSVLIIHQDSFRAKMLPRNRKEINMQINFIDIT